MSIEDRIQPDSPLPNSVASSDAHPRERRPWSAPTLTRLTMSQIAVSAATHVDNDGLS